MSRKLYPNCRLNAQTRKSSLTYCCDSYGSKRLTKELTCFRDPNLPCIYLIHTNSLNSC